MWVSLTFLCVLFLITDMVQLLEEYGIWEVVSRKLTEEDYDQQSIDSTLVAKKSKAVVVIVVMVV